MNTWEVLALGHVGDSPALGYDPAGTRAVFLAFLSSLFWLHCLCCPGTSPCLHPLWFLSHFTSYSGLWAPESRVLVWLAHH